MTANTNTNHGMLNPGGMKLDNWSLYPRGTSGEYNLLNRFIQGGSLLWRAADDYWTRRIVEEVGYEMVA